MEYLTQVGRHYHSQCQKVGEYRTLFYYILLFLLLVAAFWSFLFYQDASNALEEKENQLHKALYGLLIERAPRLSAEERIARKKRVDADLRDLYLAPTQFALNERLAAWQTDPGLITSAKEVLQADNTFIFPYRSFFVALAIFALVLAFLWKSRVKRSRWERISPWLFSVLVLAAIFLSGFSR